MKKWFDYQIQHQRDPDYKLGSASSTIFNVAEPMESVFQHIFEIYPTLRVTRRVEKVFSKDFDYANILSSNVPEVDQKV